MPAALILLLLTQVPSECFTAGDRCPRFGEYSHVVGTLEVGGVRYVGLRRGGLGYALMAILEYRRVDGAWRESRCTEPAFDPLQVFRHTSGPQRGYVSLCDGKKRRSAQPLDFISDRESVPLEDRLFFHPAPVSERADCSLIVKAILREESGYRAGAIQICSSIPHSSPVTEVRIEAAQYVIEYDVLEVPRRMICDSQLPGDGVHVSELRRWPVEVSGDELLFSDPCHETNSQQEIVRYRLLPDGTLKQGARWTRQR